MIEVSTLLGLEATGFDRDYISRKRVVVTMNADDAFALYTIFANIESDWVSDDWRAAISQFSQELLNAGNKCRRQEQP